MIISNSLRPDPRSGVLAMLNLCLVFTFSFATVAAFTDGKDQSYPSTFDDQAPQLNLRDFGAIGDGVADDGPALQSALNALAAAGGGTLFVPAGSYALVTPVTKDFSGSAFSIIIMGEPSSTPIVVAGNGLGLELTSEFIIKVGETNDAITIRALENLLVKDILFSGVQEVLTDARVTIRISDVENANIEHCEFYGVATLVGGGALIYAFQSALNITETAFLGCAGNGGTYTSIIQNVRWKRIRVLNSKFVDYGNRPDFYSKTPLAPPLSWVSIGNASDLNPLSSRREASIKNVFMDEGAIAGISALPYSYDNVPTAPFEVYLSLIRMNVSNLNASGVYLLGAERVFIERSHFGWSHRADTAINLVNVGVAVLDLVECVAQANTIRADSSTQKLVVINSTYENLQSAAQVTTVITTPEPLQDPAQYVRNQYLDILSREPAPLPHYYWTSELLQCEGNDECIGEIQLALETYLNTDPPPKVSVAGTIRGEDGIPLGGVSIALSGSRSIEAQTDPSGNYLFGDLATSGTYFITPVKRHYSFESVSLVNPAVDQELHFVAIVNRWSISGRVVAENGNRVAGATVTLSGSSSGTTTTDSEGNYLFSDLRAGGNYALGVARPHYVFPNASQLVTDLSGNEQRTFTGIPVNYVIAGRIRITGEAGLSDVTVSLKGSQTDVKSTDNNGDFSFTVPAEGNYTISAFRKHYSFSPHSVEVNSITANQEVNFTVERNALTDNNPENTSSNAPSQAIDRPQSTERADTDGFQLTHFIVLPAIEADRTSTQAPCEDATATSKAGPVRRRFTKPKARRGVSRPSSSNQRCAEVP